MQIRINVRMSGGAAYIARCEGLNKTASCTISAEFAAIAAAKKVFGETEFTLHQTETGKAGIVTYIAKETGREAIGLPNPQPAKESKVVNELSTNLGATPAGALAGARGARAVPNPIRNH